LDVILEDDFPELPNYRAGCFVQYDGNFVEAIMIKDGTQQIKPTVLTFDLNDSDRNDDPRIVFVIKDLMEGEPYVGSVSIPRSIVLEGELNETYKMWITLFDDPNDDEYDGAMGINDDE
jgi:hypothetical protein